MQPGNKACLNPRGIFPIPGLMCVSAEIVPYILNSFVLLLFLRMFFSLDNWGVEHPD